MKLLLPLGEEAMIERVVRPLIESSVDEVLVVLGHRGEMIRQALGGIPSPSLLFVENLEYERGMLSSIQAGLRALKKDTECLLIALGDQPGLEADFFSRLVFELSRTGKGILIPNYAGKRGHPILIRSRYFPFVLSLNPEKESLHALTEKEAADIIDLRVEFPEVLSDVDSPGDLLTLQGRKKRT